MGKSKTNKIANTIVQNIYKKLINLFDPST